MTVITSPNFWNPFRSSLQFVTVFFTTFAVENLIVKSQALYDVKDFAEFAQYALNQPLITANLPAML